MSDLVCTVYRGRCQIWYVLNIGGGVISGMHCIQEDVSDLVSTEYMGRCQLWYVLHTGGVCQIWCIFCIVRCVRPDLYVAQR